MQTQSAHKNPKVNLKFIIICAIIGALVGGVAAMLKRKSTPTDLISGEMPTSCDCANLYNGNPMNKNYTPQQIDDEDFQRQESDNYFKKVKKCVEKYGELDDMEKELTKTATEMSFIPNLDKAIANAKKDCGK